MLKRLLCFIIVSFILFSLLPKQAFAENTCTSSGINIQITDANGQPKQNFAPNETIKIHMTIAPGALRSDLRYWLYLPPAGSSGLTLSNWVNFDEITGYSEENGRNKDAITKDYQTTLPTGFYDLQLRSNEGILFNSFGFLIFPPSAPSVYCQVTEGTGVIRVTDDSSCTPIQSNLATCTELINNGTILKNPSDAILCSGDAPKRAACPTSGLTLCTDGGNIKCAAPNIYGSPRCEDVNQADYTNARYTLPAGTKPTCTNEGDCISNISLNITGGGVSGGTMTCLRKRTPEFEASALKIEPNPASIPVQKETYTVGFILKNLKPNTGYSVWPKEVNKLSCSENWTVCGAFGFGVTSPDFKPGDEFRGQIAFEKRLMNNGTWSKPGEQVTICLAKRGDLATAILSNNDLRAAFVWVPGAITGVLTLPANFLTGGAVSVGISYLAGIIQPIILDPGDCSNNGVDTANATITLLQAAPETNAACIKAVNKEQILRDKENTPICNTLVSDDPSTNNKTQWTLSNAVPVACGSDVNVGFACPEAKQVFCADVGSDADRENAPDSLLKCAIPPPGVSGFKPCTAFDGTPGTDTALGCVPSNPSSLINAFVRFATFAGGGIALLIMVFASIGMITSLGNAEKLKNSQEQFAAAVIGLLFIIFSVLLMQIIGVNILGIF